VWVIDSKRERIKFQKNVFIYNQPNIAKMNQLHFDSVEPSKADTTGKITVMNIRECK
jgi:hypothetical protein